VNETWSPDGAAPALRVLGALGGQGAPDAGALWVVAAEVATNGHARLLPFGFDPDHLDAAYVLAHPEVVGSELARARRATLTAHREAVVGITGPAIDALASPVEEDRIGAAFFLAFAPEAREVSLPALLSALEVEHRPWPFASLCLSVGVLARDDTDARRRLDALSPTAGAATFAWLAARALAAPSRMTTAEEDALAAVESKPANKKKLPWNDGHLGPLVFKALIHAAYMRGDERRYAALLERLEVGPGVVEPALLAIALAAGRGRRTYPMTSAAELGLDAVARVREVIAGHADLAPFLPRVGVFARDVDRERQLSADGGGPLGRVHAGLPLWRWLGRHLDGLEPRETWLDAVASLDDDALWAVVEDAANAPLGLFRAGPQDGWPQGGPRVEALNVALVDTLRARRLLGELGDRGAAYALADGLNRGLFFLDVGRLTDVDPRAAWVQHVLAEITPRWVRDPRVDALKAWAASGAPEA